MLNPGGDRSTGGYLSLDCANTIVNSSLGYWDSSITTRPPTENTPESEMCIKCEMEQRGGVEGRAEECINCLRIPATPIFPGTLGRILVADKQWGPTTLRSPSALGAAPREAGDDSMRLLVAITCAMRSGHAGTDAVLGVAEDLWRDCTIAARSAGEAQRRAAAAGFMHDPQQSEGAGAAGGQGQGEADDGEGPGRAAFMGRCASIGLTHVNTSTHIGKLVSVLLLRQHALIGPLVETHVVTFLTDLDLWHFYHKMCYAKGVNQKQWRLLMGPGLLHLLGVGLHPMKVHAEVVWKKYEIFMEPLFERYLGLRTRFQGVKQKGKYFAGVRFSVALVVYSSLCAAAIDAREELEALRREFPREPRITALCTLLFEHIPQILQRAVVMKLAVSSNLETRRAAFDALVRP
jgi:hypothetical protein